MRDDRNHAKNELHEDAAYEDLVGRDFERLLVELQPAQDKPLQLTGVLKGMPKSQP